MERFEIKLINENQKNKLKFTNLHAIICNSMDVILPVSLLQNIVLDLTLELCSHNRTTGIRCKARNNDFLNTI